jgi:hypothetical protein
MKRTPVDEHEIVETIRRIPLVSFTVLDFSRVFELLHPDAWKCLKERFGQTGEKRRCTVNTYLSNRLDVYSQKSDSLLQPFTRYSQAGFKDYRKVTEEKQQQFGGTRIAVFKKKTT